MANLLIDAPLDNVNSDNTVTNLAPGSMQGTVHNGSLDVVSNEMGRCLYFGANGQSQYIAFSDATSPLVLSNYTMSAWVKLDPRITYPQVVFGQMVDNDVTNPGLIAESATHVINECRAVGTVSASVPGDVPDMTENWLYLSITQGDDYTEVYCNGEMLERRLRADRVSNTDDTFYVGNPHGLFQGYLAHLRVYDAYLSQEQIQADMQATLPENNDTQTDSGDDNSTDNTGDNSVSEPTARESFPLDFTFYNDGDQQVIYITGGIHQQVLDVAVTNTAGSSLIFDALSGSTPSADNHHLELRFRPGTLSDDSRNSLTLNTSGWVMSDAVTSPNTQTISYYLLHTGAALTLAVGDTIHLELENADANPGSGTRNSQLEMTFENVSYDGQSTAITGNRVKAVAIVNHTGSQGLPPLHACFVGTDSLLNDGSTTNTLTIRMMASDRAGTVALNPGTASAPSAFVINLPTGTDLMAVVSSSSKVTSEEVSPSGTWSVTAAGTEGKTVYWKLTPADTTDALTYSGVDLTLHLVCDTPPGVGTIYINYENIPGYQDGQITLPVKKTPLLYMGSSSNPPSVARYGLKVGNITQEIGSNDLAVAGQISASGLTVGGNISSTGGNISAQSVIAEQEVSAAWVETSSVRGESNVLLLASANHSDEQVEILFSSGGTTLQSRTNNTNSMLRLNPSGGMVQIGSGSVSGNVLTVQSGGTNSLSILNQAGNGGVNMGVQNEQNGFYNTYIQTRGQNQLLLLNPGGNRSQSVIVGSNTQAQPEKQTYQMEVHGDMYIEDDLYVDDKIKADRLYVTRLLQVDGYGTGFKRITTGQSGWHDMDGSRTSYRHTFSNDFGNDVPLVLLTVESGGDDHHSMAVYLTEVTATYFIYTVKRIGDSGSQFRVTWMAWS